MNPNDMPRDTPRRIEVQRISDREIKLTAPGKRFLVLDRQAPLIADLIDKLNEQLRLLDGSGIYRKNTSWRKYDGI